MYLTCAATIAALIPPPLIVTQSIAKAQLDRTCPAMTSAVPSSPHPPPPPLQTAAPVTPDRGGGDGGKPSRLNALPPAEASKEPPPSVGTTAADDDDGDGVTPPYPSQLDSALKDEGRVAGAAVAPKIPGLPVTRAAAPCSLFWLWMVS